jgi:hypothetical protein
MEWIPALSTTTLFALVLWLSKNMVITRLTNAVKHEYDEKIENLRADLKARDSQVEALRSGALSGISNRHAALYNHQVKAIQELWESIVLFTPAKSISATMSVINFKEASEIAESNPKAREMFTQLGNVDLKNLPTNKALKTRPFLSSLSWAYFSAYQAIVINAVIRMEMLKIGINIKDVVDTENVTKLVKIALPHQVKYIEKYGPSAFHYLLDELETKLLMSFEITLKGEELDKDTIKKAADIIKEADSIMESNMTAKIDK